MTTIPSLIKSSDSAPEQTSTDISVTVPVSARSVFWRTRYLRQSDFMPHVPLLFWLLETSDADNFVTLGVNEGVAHFAACQAMDRLRQDARCVGIEDWSTNHGHIPHDIATYASETYHEISELIDKAPEKAAYDFDEGAVDVLLIDIDQPADSTEALLRDWLPRMSDRSVVLINGVNRTTFKEEVGRSVLSRWQERFPMFCLAGGRGLALLLTGPQQNYRLKAIAELSKGHPLMRDIHRVFTRLGEAHQFEYESRTLAGRVERAETDKSRLIKQVEDQKSAYDARNRQVGELQSRNHDLTRQHGAAQSELEALRQTIFDWEAREKAAANKARSLADELEVQRQTNALLEAERDRHKAKLVSLAKEREVQDEAIANLRDERDSLAKTRSAAQTELKVLRQTITDQEGREQAAADKTGTLTDELRIRSSELAASILEFERERRESAQQISALTQECEALTQANTRLTEERDRDQAKLATLTQERRTHNSAIAKLRTEHNRDLALLAADRNRRFGEISILIKEVERAERDLITARAQLEVIERERDDYRKHVEELLASTSWRITAPARKVVNRYRSLR